MRNSLLKKFLSFSYGSWIGLVIGFLGTIVATRLLPPEDFGKASLFTLATSIFMIFITFGTDQAFVRFFYEEKEENRGGLLYNCLKLPIKIALIITILIFIFNKKLSIFLFEEENFKVILMLILGILTQVLYRYGSLVIRMQQNGNLFSLLEIFNRTFNFFFLVLLYLSIGKSYEIIIYSTVITFIILAAVSIYSGRKLWNFKNYNKLNLVHNKNEIIQYSYPLVWTTIITWLFQSFDKFALKYWSSFEEVGLYAAAFKIVALLSMIQITFSTFWTPICYENFEKNPDNKIFYENMSKILSFAMFSIAILSIAGKDIIVLVLGQEYREAANIMPFLVFMPIMYTLSETTVIGINFYKKPKWHIVIASVSCLLNIIGNCILVPKFGAFGASAATAISYIAFFILRTHISLKYYKVNYGLKQIYFIISIIFLYALYSSIYADFFVNVLVGISLMLGIIILYYESLVQMYKNYK